MSSHVEQTIADLQAKVEEHEQQAAFHKKMVNGLCDVIGRPHVYADVEPSRTRAGSVRPDQFYGRPFATVVREILEMRKAAMAPNDIHALMEQGGYQFNAKDDENAKRMLRMNLSKNTVAFHKLPNGTYGLTEWYPAVKTPKAAKAANGAAAGSGEAAAEGGEQLEPELAFDESDGAASEAMETAAGNKPR